MAEKKDYEKAIDAFEEADAKFNSLKEKVSSGEIFQSIWSNDIRFFQSQWQQVLTHLQELLEERNKLLGEAQNALRQAVPISETQWRGPEGQATTVSYGRFKVNSKTYRSFDPQSLLEGVAKEGKLEQLLKIQTFDKKSGEPKPAVRQVYEVDYEQVKTFLRLEKLDKVFDGSYDEREGTPAVSGPKLIAFLGDTKDK